MNPNIQEPLFEEEEKLQRKFENLVKYSKVVRDPVHGDIWITELEKEIIDTIWFQRLRRIKQLGPANLVFPGANHTRFEHSIGTLYVAQQIIDAINKNYEYFFPEDPTSRFSQYPMIPEDIFITRVVALIHDAAHVSFGHMLENEGNLFDENKQWKDKERRESVLDKIFPIIRNHLKIGGIKKDKIDEILTKIEKILIAEEVGENEIKKLDCPYIGDIVGNTICADLLDYLKRDTYYTGLKMTYDPRLLSYFVLRDYKEESEESEESKPRLAILLERREGVKRRDILSDCVELLRLRYSLTEKVYYHRVKIIFSAMVIKMAYCGLKAKIIDKDKLMFWGDDALLCNIANIPEKDDKYLQAAKRIAYALLQRKLYRKVYSKIGYTSEIWSKLEAYHKPDDRYALENKLEEIFRLPPGSIIIYDAKRNRGKEAAVKIFSKSLIPPVRTLQELANEPDSVYRATGVEISTINSCYDFIWPFYVLLDSEYAEKLSKDLDEVCEDIIEKKGLGSVVRVRAKMLEEEKGIGISQSVIEEVVKATALEKDPREIKPREINVKYIDEELVKRVMRG